jgi:hypothetical protein
MPRANQPESGSNGSRRSRNRNPLKVRCVDLRFSVGRYLRWVFEAKKRFGLSVLDYSIVTLSRWMERMRCENVVKLTAANLTLKMRV